MTCTDTNPCIVCQIETINQGGPPRSIERGPTVLEAGIGGAGIAFGLYLGFALIWGIGTFIDWLLTLPGFGQWSFVMCLVSGFFGGVWYATVGRRD